MSSHCPGYASGMDKWADVANYLNYRLCGELSVDFSMASQFVCLDQRSLGLAPDVMEMLGIARGLFAVPKKAGTPLGVVSVSAASETGLRPGTPVVLGAADYITGVLGGGFTEPGDVVILTGTWELVVACLLAPALSPSLQRTGAICDAHVVPGRWALRMENYSGAVTEWYREQMGCWEDTGAGESASFWTRLVNEARDITRGAEGLLFVPHLYGSLSPRYDELARGAFLGLRASTTRAHIARALFEGLCMQSLDAYLALCDGAQLSPGRVVCMGGAAKNEFWTQTRASALGREVEVVTSPDVTPRGAAMIAGVGAGVFHGFAEAVDAMKPPTSVTRPIAEDSRFYADMFAQAYRPAVEALAPTNHVLAAMGDGAERRPLSDECGPENRGE